MRRGDKLYRVCLQTDVNDARPLPGEVWQVSGEPFIDEKNSRYGWQLLAHEACMIMPSGELLIDFLATQFDGIGRAKASAMWRSAVEQSIDLHDALDKGKVDLLSALLDKKNKRLLAPEFIPILLRRWQEVLAESKAMQWMQVHGFSKTLARRARQAWGADAVEAIEDNPYRLLAFVPSNSAAASFAKVDNLAIRKLNIAQHDSRRLLAAFECAMYQEWDNGNTAATLSKLSERLDLLLGRTRTSNDNILKNAAANLAVEFAEGSGNEILVQLRGVALMERTISERLVAMIEGREEFQDTLFQAKFDLFRLKNFEETTRIRSSSPDFALNEEQKLAVKMSLSAPISIIAGDAGTGKTTILNALFDQIISQGGAIFPMAPTGKAAKQIREATGQAHASTIAKFVLERKKGRVSPQPGAYFVIDEASMVDTSTLYELLKFIPAGSRIVFVGDPYQLPPIGAGLTFHILAKSPEVPQTYLTEVHRSAVETGIPAAARLIREQVMPHMARCQYVPDAPGRMITTDIGVLFICTERNEIQNAIIRAYREMKTKGEVQIIAAINRASPESPAVGVANLNENLQNVYSTSSRKSLEITQYKKFAEDDPVIFTRNLAARDLWNGSMGRIVEILSKPQYGSQTWDDEEKAVEIVAIAELDGVRRNMALDDFDRLELAYAITCHKSQGSAFERIIIVSNESAVLDNTWFYTAFTRARKQIVLIGDWNTMNKHVVRPPKSFNRIVGLRLKVRKHG